MIIISDVKNKGIPILVYSNKMDIKDSLSPTQVIVFFV